MLTNDRAPPIIGKITQNFNDLIGFIFLKPKSYFFGRIKSILPLLILYSTPC